MGVQLQPVLDAGLSETAALLSLGFSDYIMPVQFNLASLLAMVTSDGLDVPSCRVILSEGNPAGVALIARRGWASRLAGMAIIPEARGQGVGREAMALLLAEARGRNEKRMELEVIEGNDPAIALYERSGFRTRRRLLSFGSENLAGDSSGRAVAVDIREAAAWVMVDGLADLPWQLSGETLAILANPYSAWRLDYAVAIVSDTNRAVVGIRSLIVRPQARGQGQGAALLRALAAQFPGKSWRVPPICPEEVGGFFSSLGFTPGAISQRQMECDL